MTLSTDLNERRLQLLGSKLYHLCQYEKKAVSYQTIQRRLKLYNKMHHTSFTPKDVANLCDMKERSIGNNRIYEGCPLASTRMYGSSCGCSTATKMYDIKPK